MQNLFISSKLNYWVVNYFCVIERYSLAHVSPESRRNEFSMINQLPIVCALQLKYEIRVVCVDSPLAKFHHYFYALIDRDDQL